ncbi:MAG: nucleotide exchange factor GrpE [Minisyncoccia bacterium]
MNDEHVHGENCNHDHEDAVVADGADEAEDTSGVEYDEDTGASLVKKLREKIKKLEAEKQEYLNGWQRMKADVVNRDKVAEEQRARVGAMVKEGMLEELLPILDAFDSAFTGSAWEKVDSNWRVGIEYIHSQFKKVLDENGITSYGKVGEVFDAVRHDPIEDTEETPAGEEAKSHTVAQVLRTGYELGGRVIRPARVKLWK